MSQEKKQPISFFIPTLNGGGAQKVIVNLANAMVDLTSNPVHLVLVREEGVFLDEVRPEVKIYNLRKQRTLQAIPSLIRYLKKNRPLVLMSRINYVNVVATLSWIIARRPCRLVLSEASVARAPEGKAIDKIKQISLLTLMRITYPLADSVVANSEETARSMLTQRIQATNSPLIIYNPVIASFEHHKITGIPFPLNLSHRKQRFICAIGRLAHPKGFDQLLEAFAQLKEEDVDLVVLGEGPLRRPLEEQAKHLCISDRVHMPGFISDPSQILAKSSLFVLSSRWEGFGNVLVEALASGVPVVSTDCCGAPRAILQDGKHGDLVPPGNVHALATAMSKALTCPKGSSSERRERAKDFSASIIAKEYLEKAFGLAEK